MEILKEKVRLTLGDGSAYELAYDFSEFNEDFNYTEFEFLNVQGALVDRREAKAVRYEITVYFTDVNHLVSANNFRTSTLDKRPWIVEHPFNGTRNMQPVSIKYDNTSVAHTAVTLTLIETIMYDGLLITQDPKSIILAGNENLTELNDEVSSELIADKPSEIVNLTDTATGINNDLKNKINAQSIANDYSDTFAKMNAAIGSIGTQPITVMRQISQMLLMPKRFIDNVRDRLDFVQSQFSDFFNLVQSLPTIYTAQYLGASVISAYTVTAIPDDDSNGYQSAADVDNVATTLWTMFKEYNDELQTKQSVTGFVPNYDISYSLYVQVVTTIKNLYQIAIELPTVVEIELQNDSLAVILAHEYGMDFDTMFMINDWSIAETLIIPKGTKFKYYI